MTDNRTKTLSLIAGPVEGKIRIDAYIARYAEGLSRSLVSDKDTVITVDGKQVKKSRPVKEGETIIVTWTDVSFTGVEAQPIELSVLYEDESMLVIDKQQSLVVHPAPGNPDGTLVNALVYRYGAEFADLSEDGQDMELARPGIVHRLDKETSGVLVVAKTRSAHAALSEQFKNRSTCKYYIALVKGVMERKRQTIDAPIGRSEKNRKKFAIDRNGKSAVTDYTVLRQFGHFALLRIRIYTGRTHQIRVHMASIGHSVVGDELYGHKSNSDEPCSLMLHALSLEIDHPLTGQRLIFRAPLPDRFKKLIKQALT